MGNDVGIGALIPAYAPGLLVEADVAYWEVLYEDGTVLSEAQGGKYQSIDRGRLASFRVIHGGENVFEVFPPPGLSGRDLVYRRRTSISDSGRTVVLIVGWAPMGPIFSVDLATGSFAEDTQGLLPTLTPMPGEPDDLLLTRS